MSCRPSPLSSGAANSSPADRNSDAELATSLVGRLTLAPANLWRRHFSFSRRSALQRAGGGEIKHISLSTLVFRPTHRRTKRRLSRRYFAVLSRETTTPTVEPLSMRQVGCCASSGRKQRKADLANSEDAHRFKPDS